MTVIRVLLCLWVLVLTFSALSAPAQFFRVRPLPPVPGQISSAANDLNDLGEIVGNSGPHAVVWRSFSPIPLHRAPTPSAAMAINNLGVIVGHADRYPHIWFPDGSVVPACEGSRGVAQHITDDGLILGYCARSFVASCQGGCNRIFLLFRGVLSFPFPDQEILGNGINHLGSFVVGKDASLAVYNGEELIPLRPPAGFSHASGFAINGAGDVVGEASDQERSLSRPVVWRAGEREPIVLEIPEWASFGAASDVNDRGIIVGQVSDTPSGAGTQAARWMGGAVQVINDSLSGQVPGLKHVFTISAVNSFHEMVGMGEFSEGDSTYRQAVFIEPTNCRDSDLDCLHIPETCGGEPSALVDEDLVGLTTELARYGESALKRFAKKAARTANVKQKRKISQGRKKAERQIADAFSKAQVSLGAIPAISISCPQGVPPHCLLRSYGEEMRGLRDAVDRIRIAAKRGLKKMLTMAHRDMRNPLARKHLRRINEKADRVAEGAKKLPEEALSCDRSFSFQGHS